MTSTLLVRKFIITLILIIFANISKVEAADIVIDDGGTTTSQQGLSSDRDTLTISNESTLTRANTAVNVTANEVSVTVNSGSTIITSTADKAIFANDVEDLTVTNSGTLDAARGKTVDIKGTTNATITNNTGGVISALKNTISISGTGNNDTTGYNISNSGTIYASNGTNSAIFTSNTISTGDITNNSGGEIYSLGTQATIKLGASSAITNSGSIKNKLDTDNNAIQVLGNSNTITLKNDGIVVGKITADSGTTGNTLKFQHGFGQGYFYETSGDFTLEDLDGNQVVKGSAGSVGQGGSETLDELLGYKSLNIRKSLNRYKKSKSFIEGKDSWGEAYVSNLKRKENNNNLAIGYDHKTFGINLINPLQSSHFMLSLEHSKQDLLQDHSITRYGILTGLYFPQLKNLGKFETENFVSAGITLNDSERTILTNTTTSGILNVTDSYKTYEVIAGKKFKYFDNLSNINLIPDIGITAGYSLTPSHSESKYFIWD